jgi:preprotein translocase SecE subunit
MFTRSKQPSRSDGKPARKERRDEKRKPSASPSRGGRSGNPITRYFQETGDELRKVSWPDRPQAIRLTLIVLATMVVAAVVLGLLDLSFHELSAFLLRS